MAIWLETNGWNGYCIKIWGKDPAFGSGVRTNTFLVLETLLGYKYGDVESQSYADKVVGVQVETQWGARSKAEGRTADDGLAIHSQHWGGQLLAWAPLSEVSGASSAGDVVLAYGLRPRTILSDIIDWFGMPKEVEGVLPTNSESTLTYIQALRVYLRYRYGESYPSASWLP